jgi:signal transduction histidine kinase
VDRDGGLWVGTGNGLGRFFAGQWSRFTKKDGLTSDSINYLIEDEQDDLWIGSNDGLMRIARKSLASSAFEKTAMIVSRAYGIGDGLPTIECTQGSQPAACRTRDGRLWFPTIRGLVAVDPAQLLPNTNVPPVAIESVMLDGKEQSTNALHANWSSDIVVPAGNEQLDIYYTSLSLAAPKQARFKYRMEPYETKWIEAGDGRKAHYSKLPANRYRFQVTACNEDGVWNPKPATVSILVLPPFWQEWWFVTLVGLGVLGAVVGVVHFISTQKLQRQLAELKQQEALEKERARIARDLHDQLGANLTQVALLGELAESDKHLPDEIEGHAKQISQTARETSRALDEIVWSANPSNDTLEGLINYACKYAQDYLELAGLRYRLDVPAQLPAQTIAPDLRHNIFLAFKEAVNNVVKHAQASEVKIRLRLTPTAFTLEIEDNGRGPGEAASKTGRNGLRNMRKRMEDVGGAFVMAPGPQSGTLIQLTAPIGKH